ncbi:MAG: hypothetical protein RLZZ350_645 [Verrucomicrobiota bacterium]
MRAQILMRSPTKLFTTLTLGVLLFGQTVFARENSEVVVGNVRVQILSDTLVRLELRGPNGFEDRPTFHVVNRDWPGAKFSVTTNDAVVEVHAADFSVTIPAVSKSLAEVTFVSAAGKEIFRPTSELTNSVWLPAPGEKTEAWSFTDTPRITSPNSSAWSLSNSAPDLYVFLPRGDYRQLRRDFLALTGPTELPPLFMLGVFDSRWFDYSEASALAQIDDYRAHKIPLDVLVVDTGWRANASTGYSPNTNLFPNLPRFFREAHDKNVKVLFNDHPEPLNTNAPAFDSAEMNFRFNGLAGLLRDGLDVWWYDRNWWVALVSPAPNLRKEVWGMEIYRDTAVRVNPELRPLIMANVDGVDNGQRLRPPNVAAHRYTFQWTGDIGPGFDFLRRGVENAVHAGVHAAFPYTSEDLGGHIADPTPEGYIRWLEYGALSPVFRPHCTHNLQRMPWTFGADAERVARNYVNMRYRLLPVFYAACRENFETGEPLLRRLDLDFPEHAEAQRDDEYLLGKNILVAPVLRESVTAVPTNWLQTPDGQPGLRAEFFTNETLVGKPTIVRTDRHIDFDWDYGSTDAKIPADHFAARWTGTIYVPGKNGEQLLSATSDDGVRVWLDDQLVIDNWKGNDSATTAARVTLKPGIAKKIRVEYLEIFGRAAVKLRVQPAHEIAVPRELWLPPGEWLDAWTGERVTGLRVLTKFCPLGQIPIFVRAGALLVLAPEMQFTGEKPWSPLTLDCYPQPGATDTATLYEDDGRTIAHTRGEFRKTKITTFTDDATHTVKISIAAARGNFPGALAEREWIVRFRRPANWLEKLSPTEIKLNGQRVEKLARLMRQPAAMPFGDASGAPDGDVFEVRLPALPVTRAAEVSIKFD